MGKEKTTKEILSLTPDLLQQWKNGPVFLASSSSFRLKSLQELGFKNITTFSMPNELEEERYHWFNENKIYQRVIDYGFGLSNLPQIIAKDKVNYLLDQKKAPENALIIALDTLVMSFNINSLSNPLSHNRPELQANHLPKSKTIEEVKQSIKSTFTHLIDTHNFFQKNEEKFRYFNEAGSYILPPYVLQVNTGIAIRYPFQPEISTTHKSVNLIHSRVLHEKPENLDNLIEEIILLTKKSGRSPLDISGGVDYSNLEINELLEVYETSKNPLHLNFFPEEYKSEKDLYLGFPKEFVDNLLLTESQNQSKTSSLDNNVI
jgi:hypothetical protein